jgi:hypothetical protein
LDSSRFAFLRGELGVIKPYGMVWGGVEYFCNICKILFHLCVSSYN